MDQEKIGRFIALRRKECGMTQMQLAQKLNITDRAVSKWETGRAMPDSSIMLELCNVLGISVNDLLCGDVVAVDDYTRELENNLLQMIKEKEKSDKHLLAVEWVIGVLSVVILLLPIVVAAYLPMEDKYRIIITFSGFIPAIVGFGFALKIEQVAGYYECAKCKHRYVPTYKAVNRAPHMGRTRYLKCPNCGEKSWNKKVISKEETK